MDAQVMARSQMAQDIKSYTDSPQLKRHTYNRIERNILTWFFCLFCLTI